MASRTQGYDEERFAFTVDRNFICHICSNVLKDPVLCPRNHHCFCRDCVTKHLENSQVCPSCADELTVDTLTEPQKMIKQLLNELKIHCVYIDRGCQEILQLQHLDEHEATCGFTPAVCTNQGCGATLNQRDLIHHESEVCEFRKLKCHSCEEMTKTLTDMEERIANLEKDMASNVISMETHMKNIQTNMATNAASIEARMVVMERSTADMERKLKSVDNTVIGLETTLIRGFNEVKDAIAKNKREHVKKSKKHS